MSALLERGGGRRVLLGLFLLTLPLVTPRIRGADEIEYFSYLRSAVFDRDLEFGNEYQFFYDRDPRGLEGFRRTFLEGREPETGRHINFGPLGSALFWSPLYLLVHGGVSAAHALGLAAPAADGFSRPYEAAACYASALWGFLGLLLTHDLLRRFGGFAELPATLGTAALWLGTPLLYYMTIAPGFSHATSVFAVTLTLWLWLRARTQAEGGALADWALVGLAGGVAGLVREQDVLVLLAPGLDCAWRLLRERRPQALLQGALLCAAAFGGFLPQLFAYRALNGRFSPSRLVARKMSWSSPHFLEVLFDPGHGLFLWTPLLLVAVAGLALAWRRAPRGEAARVPALLAVALLAQVWINGAVESWTQSGAFGSRRFVGATALFAWGLAAVVERARTVQPRPWLAAALAALVWWNVGLMIQFGLKLMDRGGLDWPRVAVNQVTEVPRVFLRTAWLFLTDRERLLREPR